MQVQMLVQVRISASGGWMRPEAGGLMEVNWQDLVEVPCRYYECSIQRAWSKVLLGTLSRSPPVFSPGELGTLLVSRVELLQASTLVGRLALAGVCGRWANNGGHPTCKLLQVDAVSSVGRRRAKG